MKTIDLKISSVDVKHQTRELRAKWSREMVYDLNTFSGITMDLEKEIIRTIRIEKRKKSIKNIFGG